jgi:hypothetical protein
MSNDLPAGDRGVPTVKPGREKPAAVCQSAIAALFIFTIVDVKDPILPNNHLAAHNAGAENP